MLEKIKKYGLTLAGAALIALGAAGYLATNDHYYPRETAVVIEDDKITHVYVYNQTMVDIFEDTLFHAIHENDIELGIYDESVVSGGKVIELPTSHRGGPLAPFSEGRANSLSYERNGEEITYDIKWDVAIQFADEFFINHGPSGYHPALQEINDYVASNMNNYLENALDRLTDDQYSLLLRYSYDRDSITQDEIKPMNEIHRLVSGAIDYEIFNDLFEKYGILTHTEDLCADSSHDEINEWSSGIGEGESIAYLTGEDYITELSDFPDWVAYVTIAGTVLFLAGLAVSLKFSGEKKKREGLYTDGEIIQHAQQTLPKETAELGELVDPALYAQEQLKALENS